MKWLELVCPGVGFDPDTPFSGGIFRAQREGPERRGHRASIKWVAAIVVALTLLFPYRSFGATVTLAWDHDPANEPALAGYRLYYGISSGNYTSFQQVDGTSTSTTINLQDGVTYYLAVTAFDYSNNESGLSNEVVYGETIDRPLSPAGQGDGRTGAVYGYSTGGAGTTSRGDPLEYRFEWGDGTTSPWTVPDATGMVRAWKAWTTAGVYAVVAEARCALHPGVSALSDPLAVSVSSGGPLLLSDSFSDGTASGDSQWRTVSGQWLVGADGAFTSRSVAVVNRAVVSSLPDFSAGRISARIMLTGGALQKGAGIVFALRDARHYRYVLIRGSRIVLGQVGNTAAEGAGAKRSATRTFRANQWYRVRADVYPSGRVAVFIGNETRPVLSYRFADVVAGGIGCLAQQSVARFDDYRAWDARALP